MEGGEVGGRGVGGGGREEGRPFRLRSPAARCPGPGAQPSPVNSFHFQKNICFFLFYINLFFFLHSEFLLRRNLTTSDLV